MDVFQDNIITPLRPYLLPITTNLPSPINNLAISLLGSPCHSALLRDLNPAGHPECVKLAASKTIGVAVISAASIVKVPQILKLLSSQSSSGLSFLSYALETASFLISLAYNVRGHNPFSTYGETALIAAQDVVVGVLILQYAGKGPAAGAFVAVVAASIYALFNEGIVDGNMLGYLQAGAGALAIGSKLPQIITVYQQGGTGQLSAFAVFNYLAGSLSRIFTTLAEVDDNLILYSFIAGFILNAILAAQMVYYWKSPATASHAGELGREPEKIAMKDVPEKVEQIKEQARPKSPSTRRRG